jgi:hypothetical protein
MHVASDKLVPSRKTYIAFVPYADERTQCLAYQQSVALFAIMGLSPGKIVSSVLDRSVFGACILRLSGKHAVLVIPCLEFAPW